MDAQQFKQRFLPLHERLYHTAYRLMGMAQDAEDMVQETYMRLWNIRQRLDSEMNDMAYSITMTRHICIDHLRTRHHDADINDDVATSVESLAIDIDTKNEVELVKALVDQLPPQQRLVMMLHDAEGCATDEIEQLTGLNSTNIRVLLSRARKRIREQLTHINQVRR